MGGRNGGRKPLPTALKVMRGTAQRCRTNKDEPKVIVTRPELPHGLDAMERRSWDKWCRTLVRLGVLSEDNQSALRDLACADVRVIRSRRDMKKHGAVEMTEKGSRRSAWALEHDAARADFNRLCAEFGVTPSSRTRVRAIQPAKTEETAEEVEAREFFGA
jgi:P27 family predicted phage terminase small subunit